jgi:integrase
VEWDRYAVELGHSLKRLRSDLIRRRARVEQNAVQVGREIVVGTPKGHEARSVPLPRFLVDELELDMHGRAPNALVFGDGVTYPYRPHSASGWFIQAVRRCQKIDPTFPTLTLHDLRHTAASLTISAGAHVKAVQRMLGHASAAMTLDTYADLFDTDLDTVSASIEGISRPPYEGSRGGECGGSVGVGLGKHARNDRRPGLPGL